MGLTLLYPGVSVDTVDRRATAKFHFAVVGDLPARGSSAAWVTLPSGGSAIGASWYVDNVVVDETSEQVCTITARQPGYNWTWVGLAPVVKRKFYGIVPASKLVTGEIKLGFWNVFANWSDLDNWGVAGAIPISIQMLTWEPEWVSATAYQSWLYKANGTWPSGLTPPVAGTGKYWCKAVEIMVEDWVDPVAGTTTTYYRHFFTFWEAPTAPTPGTLTWRWSTW